MYLKKRVVFSAVATAVLATLGLSMSPKAAFAETKELRVARQYGLGFLPLMVMESEGLFEKRAKEAGLDVKTEWPTLGGPAAANDALLSRSVDIVSNGPPSFLVMWNRTLNTPLAVRAVAPLSLLPMWLMTKRADIKTLDDFTSQDRIAVTAVKTSIPAIIMQMWAAKKWGDKNYQRLDPLTTSLPHPEAMMALLSNTEITAHFASPPYQYIELKRGLHRVATSYELMGSPATFSVTFSTTAFAKENPKTLTAFYKAMEDSQKFIHDNPEKAADIYLKSSKEGVSKAEVLEILKDKDVQFTMTPRGFIAYANFLKTVGTIKSTPASWKDLFFENAYSESGD
ncbi:MAG TPA: ABC transporter substrate-binding protein [Candidatus Binataceae bacterium]|nr:ABC transporter substrate-binding protein [Candidatus Binataceae bacterium]